MSEGEIARDILVHVRSYETGRLRLFDLAVQVEKCGAELVAINPGISTQVEALAMRLSNCELTPDGEPPEAVLQDIRAVAQQLSKQP
jgi:hypothetical protein